MALTDQQKADINVQVVGARERRNAIAFGDLLSPLSAQAAVVAAMGNVAQIDTYTATAAVGYVQADTQAIIDELDAAVDKIRELQPLVAKVNAILTALKDAGLMAAA